MPIQELQAPEELKKSFLQLAGFEGPEIGDPNRVLFQLPVYVLSVRGAATGNVARNARRVGWQFLTVGPDGVSISGDAPDGAPGEPAAPSRSVGPGVVRTFSIYDAARKFDQFRNFPFRPSALRLPGLHIEAFWLRRMPADPGADQPDLDFVVPIRAFENQLQGEPILTMRQFLNVVVPLAQRLLASGESGV